MSESAPASAAGTSTSLPGLERPQAFAAPPVQAATPVQAAPPAGPVPSQPAKKREWAPHDRTIDLDAPRASRQLETPPFQPGVTMEAPSGMPARAPVTAEPKTPGGTGDSARAHERARRLARVLVSDILVYNQEKRDRALSEGNLISALGAEVNKAWELYKSKVTPEVLGATNYFKEALNEILADGQKVF